MKPYRLEHLAATLDTIAYLASVAQVALVALSEEAAPQLLTAHQFAERLQVDADTVNRWCRQGRFPRARNLGRAGWRIPAYYLYRGDEMPGNGAQAAAPRVGSGDTTAEAGGSTTAAEPTDGQRAHARSQLSGFDTRALRAAVEGR